MLLHSHQLFAKNTTLVHKQRIISVNPNPILKQITDIKRENLYAKCGINCHQNRISTFREQRRGHMCPPPSPIITDSNYTADVCIVSTFCVLVPSIQ